MYNNSMATVYLIHLERPISHAKHYLGYTSDDTLQERLQRHKSNRGARLLEVANQQGIDYHVVRTWDNMNWKAARTLERKLKNRHNSPKLCPICNPIDRKNCNDSN